MANKDKRLDDLERATGDGTVIVVDWNDGFVMVDGKRITIDEFERRYPDRKVIEWDDDYGQRE